MTQELKTRVKQLKKKSLRFVKAVVTVKLTATVCLAVTLAAGLFGSVQKPTHAKQTIAQLRSDRTPSVKEILDTPSEMKIAMAECQARSQEAQRITVSRTSSRGDGIDMANTVTATQLDNFLGRYGSPMTGLGQTLVDAGNRYQVNPALVVAIAGVESTFGKHCSGCNAWGWGRARWSSWPEAIDAYTSGLRQKYLNAGCQTIADVNRRYNGKNTWTTGVCQFYYQIMNTP